jgi:hypothetical protein
MTSSSAEAEIATLKAALYLVAIPSNCVRVRDAPLPDGVGALLRIVSNDVGATEFYAQRLDVSPEELREAAAFYLEQVMLAPGVDSYRVLGTRRHASAAQLRQNLVMLCRWLHSDVSQDLRRSVLFLRVTQAWNDLKTPERRSAYDANLGVAVRSTILASASGTPGHRKKKRTDAARAPRAWRFGKKGQEKQFAGPHMSGAKSLWRFINFWRIWSAR